MQLSIHAKVLPRAAGREKELREPICRRAAAANSPNLWEEKCSQSPFPSLLSIVAIYGLFRRTAINDILKPHHIRMKKKLFSAAAALAMTTLPSSALIKVDGKNTVNKDGSAKFTQTLEIDLSPVMAMMGNAGAENPFSGEPGQKMLVEMMKSMNAGVDVWSVAKIEAKGAATKITLGGFTKDFRAMGDMKNALGAAGDQLPFPVDELPEMKMMDMKDDNSGNSVITMAGLDEISNMLDAFRKMTVKEGKGPQEGDSANIDRDEIATGLKEGSQQWAGMKGIIAPMVQGISMKSTIEVSGTISESSVFKKTGENTATFSFGGEQIISLVDAILADEDLPDKIVEMVKTVEKEFTNEKSTKAVVNFIEPFLKEVYGGSASPKIVIKPGADAFDYAAESAKAKDGQSEALKGLIEEATTGGKAKLPGEAPAPTKKAA